MYVGVLFVVISGFATACTILFADTSTSFENWTSSHITLQKTLFGYGNNVFDDASHSYPMFGPLLLLLFIFIGMVMLLNLLIAILSHYYEEVAVDSEQRWLYLLAVDMAAAHKNPLPTDLPAPFNLPSMLMPIIFWAPSILVRRCGWELAWLEAKQEALEQTIAHSILAVTLYLPTVVVFSLLLPPVNLVMVPAHYLVLRHLFKEDDAPTDKVGAALQGVEKPEGDRSKAREMMRVVHEHMERDDSGAMLHSLRQSVAETQDKLAVIEKTVSTLPMVIMQASRGGGAMGAGAGGPESPPPILTPDSTHSGKLEVRLAAQDKAWSEVKSWMSKQSRLMGDLEAKLDRQDRQMQALSELVLKALGTGLPAGPPPPPKHPPPGQLSHGRLSA